MLFRSEPPPTRPLLPAVQADLDADSAARILDIFVAFNQVGVTVLIATHDQALVARYGKRVLHLEAGRIAPIAQ